MRTTHIAAARKKKSDGAPGAVNPGFNPNQPRNPDGKWKETGADGKSASGETDLGYFNAKSGKLGDATLISSQEFRDNDIIQKKIDDNDFDVFVSPEFDAGFGKMRVVIDGHHSLSAAVKSGNTPNFVEYSSSDHDAIGLLESGDVEGFLEAVHLGDDYHNPITRGAVFNKKRQVRVNIRTAVNAAAIRRERRAGRDVVIVPSATLPDDVVMNGIRYPAAEIEKSYRTLDGTPAPLGHPTVEGAFISASDPRGMVRGFVGAWNENVRREGGRVLLDKVIDVQFASQLDGGKAVLNAIEKGEPIHTSTGLIGEVVNAEDNAADGATRIISNMVFDHDAILLGEEGAATPDQGVGMLVNGQSVEVVNSDLEDRAERELDWAVEQVARAMEARAKLPMMARIKETLLSLLGAGNGATTEDETNPKEPEMAVTDEQFKALSETVNALSEQFKTIPDAIANAVKPLIDAQAEAVANAKAKEDAEKAELVNKIVKANLLTEDAAKAMPMNALKELAAKADPGRAAALNAAFGGGGADDWSGYDMNAMIDKEAK